ncbi:hypothetical protein A0256_09815 [Mucilaginibacter sp. PAMC 26640]|nr:hypothetical protein A0256_09815 [Mucilaginibacter sp. PAMC 26640]
MRRLSYSLIVLSTLSFFIATGCKQAGKGSAGKADSVKADSSSGLKATSSKTGKLVGAWHDETIKSDKGEQIAYEVISSGSKVYIQAITFVGTNLKLNDTPPITDSASEIVKDGDKYHSVERPTEIYVVDKSGDLLIYDGTELVAKCKRLI